MVGEDFDIAVVWLVGPINEDALRAGACADGGVGLPVIGGRHDQKNVGEVGVLEGAAAEFHVCAVEILLGVGINDDHGGAVLLKQPGSTAADLSGSDDQASPVAQVKHEG